MGALVKIVIKNLMLLCLFIIGMFSSLIIVKADEEEYYNKIMGLSSGYEIDSYDVNIDVKENNEFIVTENIEANFKVPKHGIIREIPLKNIVKRNDGSTTKNSVRITNINVNEQYTLKNKNGSKVIQIGDADETITGKKFYKIEYKYNLGKDPLKEIDELYFNIIGDKWDTRISNITFTVNMPKSFDVSKLGFSAGRYGMIGSDKVEFKVEGTKIIGKFLGTLNANEALTLRCELPEGYFTNAGVPLPILFPLMFIVPLLCLSISFYFWHKYGRDDEVIETVEFYPPAGLNSAEVAYFYKSSVSSNDANSLLIYLANKGYIKIVDTGDKTKKDDNYKIIKLKDYDGDKKSESIFMDGLFGEKMEVTKDDLYNNFYKTIEKVKLNIDNFKNKALIYETNSFKKRTVAILLVIISLITTLIIPTLDYGTFDDIFTVLIIMGVFAISSFSLLKKEIPLILRIVIVGLTIICSLGLLVDSPIYYAAEANSLTLVALIFGMLASFGIAVFIKYMSKRTPYGTLMYGKVKGFKNFLETAEKEKLEALVLDDPTYFYNILPFTYVFGISDKWIKKFESIALPEPEWYDSEDTFTTIRLNRFLLSTMNSASYQVVEASSYSSGGGFSGGGFSGGGSGGGGGSSW